MPDRGRTRSWGLAGSRTTSQLPFALLQDFANSRVSLIDAAGLQRGRLTGLVLRGEDLVGADQVVQQISLDRTREDRLVAEGACDRIRDKFGPGVISPAATLLRVS